MGVIKVLKKQEIEASLEGLTRQYFAGNLKRPQKLPYFQSDDLEIGITSYDGFHSEPVHIHACAVEYQYMISGRTQYMDVETREVFEFTAGDLPNQPRNRLCTACEAGNRYFIYQSAVSE